MYDLIDTSQDDSKLEGASIVTEFTQKAPDTTPKVRKPEGPLLGKLPPHGGYWQDPETGTEYSGGMEIAPTKGLG